MDHADWPTFTPENLVDVINAAVKNDQTSYAVKVTGGYVIGCELEQTDNGPRIKHWSMFGPVSEADQDQLVFNAWLNAKPLTQH